MITSLTFGYLTPYDKTHPECKESFGTVSGSMVAINDSDIVDSIVRVLKGEGEDFEKIKEKTYSHLRKVKIKEGKDRELIDALFAHPYFLEKLGAK